MLSPNAEDVEVEEEHHQLDQPGCRRPIAEDNHLPRVLDADRMDQAGEVTKLHRQPAEVVD